MPFFVFCMALHFDDLRTAAYHPKIHNFGNTGLGGRLHAAVAGFATDVIDFAAYSNKPLRPLLAEHIAQSRPGGRVVDVGCGVGTLTRELAKREMDVVGIDASEEMIDVAKRDNPDVRFRVKNAADLGTEDACDVAVACMLAHELPTAGHYELIGNMIDATRERRGEVWIADICPAYEPSDLMLSGEPYVLNYLSQFQQTVKTVCNAWLSLHVYDIVPDRVTVYRITRF